jgi:hypothetical protein
MAKLSIRPVPGATGMNLNRCIEEVIVRNNKLSSNDKGRVYIIMYSFSAGFERFRSGRSWGYDCRRERAIVHTLTDDTPRFLFRSRPLLPCIMPSYLYHAVPLFPYSACAPPRGFVLAPGMGSTVPHAYDQLEISFAIWSKRFPVAPDPHCKDLARSLRIVRG